jgi:hypothetical protein
MYGSPEESGGYYNTYTGKDGAAVYDADGSLISGASFHPGDFTDYMDGDWVLGDALLGDVGSYLIADPSGSLSFSGLPSGSYTVYLYPCSDTAMCPMGDISVNGQSHPEVFGGDSAMLENVMVGADGVLTVTCTSTDEMAMTLSIAGMDLTGSAMDITAPTISVSDPSSGIKFAGSGLIRVSADIADETNGSGIDASSVAFSSIGASGSSATQGSGNSWYRDFNLSGSANQNVTVSINAADEAGNSAVQQSATIRLDTSAPTLSVSAPAGSYNTLASSLAISASACDDSGGSGMQLIHVTVRNGSSNIHNQDYVGSSVSVAVSLQSGENTVGIYAEDAVGNRSATVTRTVTYAGPCYASLSVADAEATEGGDDGSFLVTLHDGNGTPVIAPEHVVVSFGFGGTATKGVDYADFGSCVTVPAGSSSQTILVDTSIDTGAAVENAETVFVSLSSAGNDVGLRVPLSGTVTISDNDVLPEQEWPGTALSFDGMNDCVNVPYHSDFSITGPVTVEAWVCLREDKTQVLLDRSQDGYTAFALKWQAGSGFRFEVGYASAVYSSPDHKPALNRWHHVVGYYDGSIVGLYVDGRHIGTSSAPSQLQMTSTPMTLGCSSEEDLWLNGYMDNVRIWDEVRTEEQILENMYNELSGEHTGLVASYLMSDAVGTVLQDHTRHGHAGTLYDGAAVSNGPAWAVSGARLDPRRCFDFTGAEYADVPGYEKSAATVTVEAWVQADSRTMWGSIAKNWNKQIDCGQFYLGLYGSEGRLSCSLAEADGTLVTLSEPGSDSFPVGSWQHVAFVADGAHLRLYRNGVEVAEPVAYDGTIYTSRALTSIGTSEDSGGHYHPWDGKIDEVRIWNEARTPAQLREGMCRTLAGTESGLAVYLRCDAEPDAAATECDGSGNGNHALLLMPNGNRVFSDAFHTWAGTDRNWFAAANWSCGSVPAANDNVGIYAWECAGEVEINAAQELNCIVLSAGTDPGLNSGLTVNGALIVGSDVNLNGQTVLLGPTATLVEDHGGFYGSGTLSTTRTFNNFDDDVAGLGLRLTVPYDYSDTMIIRDHIPRDVNGNGIARAYTIGSNIYATAVAIHYREAELNGIDENTLLLFNSLDDGATWVQQGGVVDTEANRVTLAAAPSVGGSVWTLGEGRFEQAISGFLPTNGATFETDDTPVLSATASSGLPVSYTVLSGPAQILSGTNLLLTGEGTVVIEASQPGNYSYAPAPPLSNTCTVTYSALPGNGTAEAPYRITGKVSFDAFCADSGYWNGYTRLDADIDLSGREYDEAPIAPPGGASFEGGFDGNGHAIHNLSISYTDEDVGLFGSIHDGSVRNLELVNIEIYAGNQSWDVGGLCGYANGDAEIENCFVSGLISVGYESFRIGGLCGQNKGTIRNCGSDVDVSVYYDCRYVGGLCGFNDGEIICSYSEGAVTNDTGCSNVGGFCGKNSATVSGCFWDTDTSGFAASDGGAGKTTGEMQEVSTFTAAGWDFFGETQNGTNDVWLMPPNDSPLLHSLAGRQQVIASFTPVDGTLATVGESVVLSAMASSGEEVSFALIAGPASLEAGTNLSFNATGTVVVVASQAGNASFDVAGPVTNSYDIYTALPGLGTEAAPWRIESRLHFDSFRVITDYWSGHTRLDVDLDLSGTLFTAAPIAGGDTAFSGMFDGNGHRIANLLITGSSHYLGLFGNCSGSVFDLGIEDLSMVAADSLAMIGGLCGANDGTVSRCYVTGSIDAGDSTFRVGGLCGKNTGTIRDSHAAVAVSAGQYANDIGGLCGLNGGGLRFCYSTGIVSADSYAYDIGGFCGDAEFRGSLDACFWDTATSGQAGSDGGSGKTTVAMHTETTFTSASWDFGSEVVNGTNQVWSSEAGGYPQLSWTMQEQSISGFLPLDGKHFGVTASATPSATASSGLSVQFAVLSGSGSISGTTLSFSGIGDVVVAAYQPGNAAYGPAAVLTRTYPVGPFSVVRSRQDGEGVSLDLAARSGRTYRVYKRDNSLAGARALLSSDAAASDTLSIDDPNLVGEGVTARFYDVVEDDGGVLSTNPTTYAAYVTPTVPSRWYRLSMPINLGASNRLDSTLGDMLRSGAAGDALSGDLVYAMTATGSWHTFALADDNTWRVGTPTGAAATNALASGQAFWMKRRSSGSSTNAVYTGPVITEGTPISFGSNTWQLIAWPFPTPRREDAGANGWGFASAGAQTGTSWMTADNFWVDGKLLWLHTDGRWRKANGTSAADMQLEAMNGYYYLHRGAGFTWTPED